MDTSKILLTVRELSVRGCKEMFNSPENTTVSFKTLKSRGTAANSVAFSRFCTEKISWSFWDRFWRNLAIPELVGLPQKVNYEEASPLEREFMWQVMGILCDRLVSDKKLEDFL